MLRCWSRAGPTRTALIAASLLAVLDLAAPARAESTPRGASEVSARVADTGAGALQAVEPDHDLPTGGRVALSRGPSAGLQGLRQGAAARPHRVTADVNVEDDRQAAYKVGTTQPLVRTWGHGDRLWLGERFTHDPGGQTGGHLGLYYHPRTPDEDLTLAVTGTAENHRLQDYQRFGVGTELRSQRFELGTSLFDDVPGARSAGSGVVDRRLDGYGIAVGARVPELPWAWIRVRKQWQTPVEGEEMATSDRLSLQLGRFAPLEVETGSTGDGEHRSWFAQLRFRIELGGSR